MNGELWMGEGWLESGGLESLSNIVNLRKPLLLGLLGFYNYNKY